MPKKVKKAPAKKKAVKKVVKPAVVVKPVLTELPEPDRYCHCTKRKRNCILTCVFIGSFIIGFLVSQICFCGCCRKHAPKVQFVNGCVDVASIKCPKMLEMVPMMDADNDGCITKTELRTAKKAMHHHKKHGEEPAVNVEDAIAPVME